METPAPIQSQRPLMTFFLQPFPDFYADDSSLERFDPQFNFNVTPDGQPAFLVMGRSKTPPTSIYTPGHTIPSGYTPSGKWRPSKFAPGKTDKRAGK